MTFADPYTVASTSLPSILTSAPDQDGLSKLALMLTSLGAGMTSAGARNQPFYMGIAPGAEIFGNSLLQQRQLDDARALRNYQLGIQGRELQLKERAADQKMAGMRAAAEAFAPPTPGIRPDTTPSIGPGKDYFAQTAADETGGSASPYTQPNLLGSGAYGKYQFMPDTWADVAKKHPELGLPFNMKQATADQQEAAKRALDQDNAAGLRTAGIVPTADNLYLAHRFGVGGANTMLRADPSAPVASLYPALWTEQNPDMRGVTAGQFREGVQRRYGTGSPDIGPAPTLAEVPKPALPEADRARLQKLVLSGAITPEQGLTEANKIIGDLWAQQRESAKTRYTQEGENWRFVRGKAADTDLWEPMAQKDARMFLGVDYDPKTAFQRNRRTGEIKRIDVPALEPKAVGNLIYDPRTGKLMDPVFGSEVGGTPGQVAQGDAIPGDPTPRRIEDVPPQMRTYVQGLLDGTVAAPSARQMLSPQWQAILEAAKSVDPAFDMTTYGQRQQQAKDFAANGKSGQAIQSASNLVNHLVGWTDKYKALNNGDYRAANWIGNQLASQKGEAAIAAFTAQSKLVASELAKLMKGSEPSEKEITEYQSMLSPNLSPDQAQAVAETILEMMRGRVGPIGETYERVMGRKWNNGELLTPDAVANLKKLHEAPIPGSAAAKTKPAGAQNGQSAGPIRIDLTGRRQ